MRRRREVMSKMIAFYVDKVKKGLININEIPKLWIGKVITVLQNQK